MIEELVEFGYNPRPFAKNGANSRLFYIYSGID
jgi:hypothetical protein